MSEFATYVPASTRRRFAAFFVNLSLLGVIFKIFAASPVGLIGSFLPLALVLLCCVFPESPGKRIFGLKIVDEKMMPIGTSLRLYRAVPYLLFFAAPVGHAWSESNAAMAVSGLISLFSLFFVLANGLAVHFSPTDHSLLDMKLGTRVVAPRKVPGQESPRILGVRVW
jgi:uncharacterized RDD family membrane protein YckC